MSCDVRHPNIISRAISSHPRLPHQEGSRLSIDSPSKTPLLQSTTVSIDVAKSVSVPDRTCALLVPRGLVESSSCKLRSDCNLDRDADASGLTLLEKREVARLCVSNPMHSLAGWGNEREVVSLEVDISCVARNTAMEKSKMYGFKSA